MAEPKQRSRFLFRVQLSDDLSDQLDEALEIAKLRTVLNPLGEAAKGALSNPALGGLVVGGALAAIVAVKGKDVIDALTLWYGGVQGLLDAETHEEKSRATLDVAEGLRQLIRFFSPLGPFTPLPEDQEFPPPPPPSGGGSG